MATPKLRWVRTSCDVTPTLQMWVEAEDWMHDDFVEAGGYWETVPTEIEDDPCEN